MFHWCWSRLWSNVADSVTKYHQNVSYLVNGDVAPDKPRQRGHRKFSLQSIRNRNLVATDVFRFADDALVAVGGVPVDVKHCLVGGGRLEESRRRKPTRLSEPENRVYQEVRSAAVVLWRKVWNKTVLITLFSHNADLKSCLSYLNGWDLFAPEHTLQELGSLPGPMNHTWDWPYRHLRPLGHSAQNKLGTLISSKSAKTKQQWQPAADLECWSFATECRASDFFRKRISADWATIQLKTWNRIFQQKFDELLKFRAFKFAPTLRRSNFQMTEKRGCVSYEYASTAVWLYF